LDRQLLLSLLLLALLFVAWPQNLDGVVYQKDLGKRTEVLAKGMKEYNPDSSCKRLKSRRRWAADPKASGKK